MFAKLKPCISCTDLLNLILGEKAHKKVNICYFATYICIYRCSCHSHINKCNTFHAFFGVLDPAFDPERPFSVLSIPEELTRHSLL